MTEEELINDTIKMWQGTVYTHTARKTTSYPIELATSIILVRSAYYGEYLQIQTRANYPFGTCYNTPGPLHGEDNCKAAFKLARTARRALSEVLEGGNITAFGEEIYVHDAFLLKALLSLTKKKIVHPIGTRICLMIFKKGKWLDSCRTLDGNKEVTLLIDTKIVLKGIK
jgi:hypothetical protein